MNNPDAQYERIKHLFPKQRGNVVIDHLTFWRALPKEFGKWSTFYRRFRYWITIGVFDCVLCAFV